MLEKSDDITKLATALVRAQKEVEIALKASTNPHYGSSYADLTSVLGVIKPALAAHGLALVQYPGYEDGIVTMVSILLHDSGQYLQSPVAAIPITRQDPHGATSGVTYLRRTCASSLMALIASDDDGNEAMAQAPKVKSTTKPGKAAFDPKEVKKFAKGESKAKTREDLGLALKTLEAVIPAAESDGTKVEARHVQLAREVLEQQGGGIEGGNPIDRVVAATTYLSDALQLR